MPLYHIPNDPDARPILGLSSKGEDPAGVLRPGDPPIDLPDAVAATYYEAGLRKVADPRKVAKTVGALEDAVREGREALAKVVRQRDLAVADVARLKADCEALRAETRDLTERLSRAELDVAERDAVAAKLRAELDDAAGEVAARDAAIAELRAELQVEQERRDAVAAVREGDPKAPTKKK